MEYSSWYDLVFHVLANLPVARGDASRLYDPRYVQWVNRKFPPTTPEERTLPADSSLIAALYDRAEKAFHLNNFPLLFNDFEEFNATMDQTFDKISWGDSQKSQMAGFFMKNLPPELVELFRIALWSEANAGYWELHREHIIPLYKKQIPGLEHELSTIAEKVRGLANVRFMVSHPLRRSGRLLWPGNEKEPLVVIGLPDNELDVPVWAPVIQGCHEYVLSKVLNTAVTSASHTTRPNSQGYFYHMAPEITALSIEARLFKGDYRDWFCQWIKGCLPPTCKALAGVLPWEVKNIPQGEDTGTLVDWLASGEAVPDSQKKIYESGKKMLL
jgi:hypothetical protein